eukprot:3298612-Prymnesium_polylepis.1
MNERSDAEKWRSRARSSARAPVPAPSSRTLEGMGPPISAAQASGLRSSASSNLPLSQKRPPVSSISPSSPEPTPSKEGSSESLGADTWMR